MIIFYSVAVGKTLIRIMNLKEEHWMEERIKVESKDDFKIRKDGFKEEKVEDIKNNCLLDVMEWLWNTLI